MIHTDCPVCDSTIRLDDENGCASCDACGVTLELAADDAPALALAA